MKYVVFILLLLLTACGQTDERILKNTSPTKNATGKLIPINFKDSMYLDVAGYAHDTVTKGGWKISYLVKDDTTHYNDLYIQWEKGRVKRVYKDSDVLLMKPYFIPVLSGENKTHIFLEHACATGCSAVLVLPKDSKADVDDFEAVFGYNVALGQVVYRNSSGEDTLSVSAIDINKSIEKSVVFKNKNRNYIFPSYSAFSDTLIFKGDKVIIDCEVNDENGKEIIERQVIRF
jgi:hypothetical protein